MTGTFVVFDNGPYVLGESPHWDAVRRCLWWVDIKGQSLHGRGLADHTTAGFAFDEVVTSVNRHRDRRLVVGLRHTFILFDPETGKRETLAEIEGLGPDHRLNDAKTSPDGCLWAGTINEAPDRAPIGSLYRITPKGAVEVVRGDLKASNGLAWSADGQTIYHSDTRAPSLSRASYDPVTGVAGGFEAINYDYAEFGRADGAATTMDGSYWSCGVDAGRLNRFTPDGALAASLALPVRRPSMIAFGGDQLTLMFVTSISEGLAPEDGFHDGAVLLAEGEVAGVPITPFGI